MLSGAIVKRMQYILAASSWHVYHRLPFDESSPAREMEEFYASEVTGGTDRNCAVLRRRAWTITRAGSTLSGEENFTRQFHLPDVTRCCPVEVPSVRSRHVYSCGGCGNCAASKWSERSCHEMSYVCI